MTLPATVMDSWVGEMPRALGALGILVGLTIGCANPSALAGPPDRVYVGAVMTIEQANQLEEVMMEHRLVVWFEPGAVSTWGVIVNRPDFTLARDLLRDHAATLGYEALILDEPKSTGR